MEQINSSVIYPQVQYKHYVVEEDNQQYVTLTILTNIRKKGEDGKYYLIRKVSESRIYDENKGAIAQRITDVMAKFYLEAFRAIDQYIVGPDMERFGVRLDENQEDEAERRVNFYTPKYGEI